MRDPQYLQWLMQQQWFGEKFSHLIQIVQVTNNFGAVQEKTPEHNAMQAQFLYEDFRKRVAASCGAYASIEAKLKWHTEHGHGPQNFTSGDFKPRKPEFERFSDVCYSVGRGLSYVDNCDFVVLVECKPCVGDDYPNVLRQMQRNADQSRRNGWLREYQHGRWILLIRQYSGTTVSRDQFVEIFKNSGITVLFQNELPELDAIDDRRL